MELKPCPFCGGSAKLQEDMWPRFVYCTVCNARTKNMPQFGDEGSRAAVESWNRRANDGTGGRMTAGLISRAAAIDAFAGKPPEYYHTAYICDVLKQLSDVDAVPVVHARWKDNGNETVSCSRCATWFPKEREPYMLYCGCCGARMDGERRDGNGTDA